MVTFKYRAFLDTNVLLDVLCVPERPSAASSRLIFESIRAGILEGILSTQSILDAHYILSRLGDASGHEALGQSILSLSNYLNIESIHIFDIKDAIRAGAKDLEDEALFAHAYGMGCDAIITSDRVFRKHKTGAGPEMFTPDTFAARLRGQDYSSATDSV